MSSGHGVEDLAAGGTVEELIASPDPGNFPPATAAPIVHLEPKRVGRFSTRLVRRNHSYSRATILPEGPPINRGLNPCAEYSRSFMRQACAYLEGKTVQAVTAQELNRVSGGNSRGQAVTPANASLPDTPPEESAGTAESMRRLTPKGALTTAHSGTRLPGSTTACVMRLDRTTNKLSAANLVR
jgi:hypothetical protein